MAAAWRSALPVLLVTALIALEDRIPLPSCDAPEAGPTIPDDPTVMIVADLRLMGPDASFVDRFFREAYTSKFLRKSLDKLRPDMLIVLGDISARGSELTEDNWVAILQKFQWMLGPFVGLPLHIVLGDRDIGDCSKLDGEFVSGIASKLPGLDPAGCGVFEINNITFVTLNSVALLCGDSKLRFSVEKVVERESFDARNQEKDAVKGLSVNDKESALCGDMHWRENDMAPGSGPVLLLHFPLHRRSCSETHFPRENFWSNLHKVSRTHDHSGNVGKELDGLMQHMLPSNATEYIFRALKPRIVFTAHTHNFCDHIHCHGTREVTIPAMTWAAGGPPGFIVATFKQNKGVTVRRCFLASESYVILAYVFILILFIATALVMGRSFLMK